MTILVAGLLIFLGVHAIPMRQELRASLINRFGAGGYKGLFSLTAAIGLILVIWGYGLAREESISIYSEPPMLRHIMQLFMLPVFILFIATYLPGKIKATIKHPMLISVKLWAAAHLLVNGNLEDLLLFGSFLVWAVFSVISAKQRERANPPAEKPASSIVYDGVAVVAGLGIYVGFVFWGHELVTGVPLIA